MPKNIGLYVKWIYLNSKLSYFAWACTIQNIIWLIRSYELRPLTYFIFALSKTPQKTKELNWIIIPYRFSYYWLRTVETNLERKLRFIIALQKSFSSVRTTAASFHEYKWDRKRSKLREKTIRKFHMSITFFSQTPVERK